MTSNEIAITGVAATIIVGIISWIISALIAKKSMKRKELQYKIKISTLLNNDLFKEADKLEIKYKDDIIDELVFLEIDIINSGNVALINPPIKIESRDSTYIIPAYIEELPDGYDEIWSIEREDGETSKMKINHINPGEIIKARFLMDKMPPEEPMFICNMPNLKLKKISDIKISPIMKIFLDIISPEISNVLTLKI